MTTSNLKFWWWLQLVLCRLVPSWASHCKCRLGFLKHLPTVHIPCLKSASNTWFSIDLWGPTLVTSLHLDLLLLILWLVSPLGSPFIQLFTHLHFLLTESIHLPYEDFMIMPTVQMSTHPYIMSWSSFLQVFKGPHLCQHNFLGPFFSDVIHRSLWR